MSEDRFLGRWSRLKRAQEAARHVKPEAEKPISPPEDPVTDAMPVAATPAAAGSPQTDPPELTQAEIDALPRVEDLVQGDDIRAFLRKGVPRALRQAALRRAWRLNPVIRDYVNDAREYALDYNAPAGVPGGGSVSPKDVAKLLGTLFSTPGTAEAGARSGCDARGEAGPGETGAPDLADEVAAHRDTAPDAPDAPDAQVEETSRMEQPRAAATPERPPARPRLRHGGATPV